jgi:Peptidase family M23
MGGDVIPIFLSPTGSLEVRQQDSYGSGAYLAARTTGIAQRQHLGLDLICRPGGTIYAPCDGVITRIGYVYPGDRHYFSVHVAPFDSPLVDFKMLYVACDFTELEKVERGAPIGRSQDLDLKYPGITQHCHVEILIDGQHVDPGLYLEANVGGKNLVA